MATFTTESLAVKLKLNNGTTTTGAVKTVNVGLGGSSRKIDPSTYTTNLATMRTQALTLAEALAPIFAKSVYKVTETTEGELQ